MMPFRPTEFTQVNPAINRVLVRRAIALLDPKPGERIADLFCGLGNFTLPIARRGAEWSASKAAPPWCSARRQMPQYNGLRRGHEFVEANLFETTMPRPGKAGAFRQDADRSAARRRGGTGQGAGRKMGRSASFMCRAIRPRWRAMPECWCMTRAMR